MSELRVFPLGMSRERYDDILDDIVDELVITPLPNTVNGVTEWLNEYVTKYDTEPERTCVFFIVGRFLGAVENPPEVVAQSLRSMFSDNK